MSEPDRTASRATRTSSTSSDLVRVDSERGPRFNNGDVLNGRFRVIQLLGRGGMGEVYQVEDLELRETVAVKTVRLDHADARVQDRFRREIQLARRITHPNVCRVFDVFRGDATADAKAYLFVTMELLSGQTLARRIAELGPMPFEEARAAAEQIASALVAAHAAGILHRDLKPSNVMLPTGTDASHGRVVVTDFGLATSVSGAMQQWELTTPGEFLGTPAYMAPEQVRGETATIQTDVYAFGLLLYEMLIGRPAFSAESPLACASKRLTDVPEDPRTYVPDLPSWASELLNRCLARDPADRHGSMQDVLDALRAADPADGPSRRVGLGGTALALAGIAISALSAWGGYTYWRSDRVSTAARSRPAIALMGFSNVSGRQEVSYVSTALAEGLGSALSSARELRVVPGEHALRTRAELGLTTRRGLSQEDVRQIRRNLDVDYIVAGSYTTDRDPSRRQIQVDIDLHDTTTGETIGRISHMGNEAELLALVATAAAELRQKLGLPTVLDESLRRVRTSLPNSEEARRAYAEGLDALSRSEARAARDRFEYTIAHEPEFAHAHIQLSFVYALLGFDAQARTQATAALELAGSMPADERRWIEALHHEMHKDWPRAIAQYKALSDEFPDEPEYALRLAHSQINGGRVEDAKVTIDRLKRIGGSEEPDPLILIAEADAAQAQGDAKRQAEVSLAAIQAAEARGAPLLLARACLLNASALETLEDRDAAMRMNERARHLYQQGGDRRGVARTLINIGGLLHEAGESAKAQQALRTALNISRELGTHVHTAAALNDLASVLFDSGDFSAAAGMYDEALLLSRQVGDKNGEARALGNKASVLYELEDAPTALALSAESLAIKRELRNDRAVAFTLINMGDIAAELGDLQRAATVYEEARGIASRLGDKEDLSYALTGLAHVAVFTDQLSRARVLVDEAIALRKDLGRPALVAEARLALANILVQQQAFGEATDILRLVTSLSSTDVDASTRTQARALLCMVLLQEGKPSEARDALGALPSAERSSVSMGARYLYDISEGMLTAESGDPERSIKMLMALAQKARRGRLKAYELQITLALARVQTKAVPAAARRTSHGLQRDAHASGFALIARQAQAVASRDQLTPGISRDLRPPSVKSSIPELAPKTWM